MGDRMIGVFRYRKFYEVIFAKVGSAKYKELSADSDYELLCEFKD